MRGWGELLRDKMLGVARKMSEMVEEEYYFKFQSLLFFLNIMA